MHLQVGGEDAEVAGNFPEPQVGAVHPVQESVHLAPTAVRAAGPRRCRHRGAVPPGHGPLLPGHWALHLPRGHGALQPRGEERKRGQQHHKPPHVPTEAESFTSREKKQGIKLLNWSKQKSCSPGSGSRCLCLFWLCSHESGWREFRLTSPNLDWKLCTKIIKGEI